ncbi:molecular chaperone [Chlorobium sp. BLA1]|uniref:fimbrial biogenesis chaperone n=1 Tax=Candidatus Chlorobium masyuteum TaxID=2716876 RepID=UPI00142393B5|nr:molecular chaperone [Candidatus Chlorobium masyuteum]NHQ59747.1 molecular chaperone [Candidatus Chlorobium masyuteum]NTU44971.1 molecular chaperone [Chlorobiaceae bacterium]
MKRIVTLTILLLLSSLSWRLLCAEEPPGQVAVSPAMFEINIGSKPVNESIRIKNLKKNPVTLKVEVYNWTLDEQNKLKILPPDSQSLDQWMIINPVSFTIDPGNEQVIRFSIRPRTLPNPGEHRAVIYFAEQLSPTNPGGVEILFKLGVGVYGYAEKIQRSASLQGVTLDRASGTLKVDIQNSGNVHTRLKGEYALWKKDGFPGFKSIGSYMNWPRDKKRPDWFIGSGSMNNTPVLAGQRRTITTKFDPPDKNTGYIVTVSGTIDGKKIEKILQ